MSNFANSKSVILKNVRLDFFDAYRPNKPMKEGGKSKYKAKVIIEPNSEAFNAAKAGMLEAANALWGANAKNVVQAIASNMKALRNGNGMIDNNGEVRPEYKDKFFVSCSNDTRPKVVGPKKHNGAFVDITEDGRGLVNGSDVTVELGWPVTPPYRGCYVNLKVTFVAGKSFKAGDEVIPNQIYAKFEALQFVRNGEAFGSGPTSAEGFDDEDVETTGAGSDADDSGLF